MTEIIITNLPDGRRKQEHQSGYIDYVDKEQVEREGVADSVQALVDTAVRAILADNNPCGFKCPAGQPYSCGCESCAKRNGFYKLGEKESFSIADQAMIDLAWDNERGYLQTNESMIGCALPRRLRSLFCLKTVCGGLSINL